MSNRLAFLLCVVAAACSAQARHPGYAHYRFRISNPEFAKPGGFALYDEHEDDLTPKVASTKGADASDPWVRIDFNEPVRAGFYAWWTADDSSSLRPRGARAAWRFQGSADSENWIDLDARAGYPVPTNCNFRVGPFGCPPPEEEPVDAVDPFMGTGTDMMGREGCGGMSHPGARVPFGMTQVVADTPRRDSSNYLFYDTRIEGISCTRLNGVGYYGDFGNFLVCPTVDLREIFPYKAISEYSHSRERAEPGYYATFFDRFGVFAEMTATARGAMMRFTYPETDTADIVIDLARRIALKSHWSVHSRQSAKVVAANRLEGEMFYSMLDGGWGKGDGKSQYRMFFVCEFSRPLDDVLFYDGNVAKPGFTSYEGSNVVFAARFRAAKDDQILLKVAFSYTDMEGARKNFAADFPASGFDFDSVRASAKDAWRDALDVITVKGGTPRDRAVFESCLFFAMHDPRVVADVDGRYRAADKVFQSNDFAYRTIFSGWDVFRSEIPLLGLIRPKDLSDTVNSLMATMEANGRNWLPVWDIFGCDSACMLGNPAIPTILEAYVEGIKTFDAKKALAASRSSMEERGNGSLGYKQYSLSHTVEYAYNDWCTGRLADFICSKNTARYHYARSLFYKNCWCDEVDWFRARHKGGWAEWKGLTKWNQGTAESNPYQQGWFVPHDPEGLAGLLGGERRFVERLEEFMSLTPGPFDEDFSLYYFHSNEPVHLIPFLFHHADRPDLTQKWTRRICANLYDIGSRGLCGAEDEGQMSAWYVLASMGLHPACPGAGVWMVTSPVFDEVRIRLDPAYYKGKSFTIRALNNSPRNIYIQRARLNGKALNRLWLRYGEVTAGGVLELEMGPTAPNFAWHRPPNPLTE